MSRDLLEAMAELSGLSGTRFWVYEDIQSLEFLLGDDVAGD